MVAVLGLFFVTRRGREESVSATPAPSQTSQPTSPEADTPEAPAEELEQDKSAAESPDKGAPGSRGLPSEVARALDAKKTVVVLFWNKNGVDDRSVKKSIDRLSRRGGAVAKFTDTVAHLSRYTRITAAASVSSTPSLVVVNRRGQAEDLDGYSDYQTSTSSSRTPLGASRRSAKTGRYGSRRAYRGGDSLSSLFIAQAIQHRSPRGAI